MDERQHVRLHIELVQFLHVLHLSLFYEEQCVLGVPPLDLGVLSHLCAQTIDRRVVLLSEESGPIIRLLLVDVVLAALGWDRC